MDKILQEVRDEVLPSERERNELQEVAQDLREMLTSEMESIVDYEFSITQTGSTARGTWVSGDRDIDMFIEFPTEVPETELESVGLDVGMSVVPDGRKEYASHPYTKGVYKGYEVDVVPCYAVESSSQIISAVDRTPFHTRYLESNLTESLAEDVVLMKKFMKSAGVYGSEVSTGGFSGYLTELLVYEMGGFKELLEFAANCKPNIFIDIEDHGNEFDHISSFVVIDPTDKDRDVASALSVQKWSEFQHVAREFLSEPSINYFKSDSQNEMETSEVKRYFENRGMDTVSLKIPRDDSVVDDTIYPQARKSIQAISNALEDYGFDVQDMYLVINEDEILFTFELKSLEIPRVYKQEGPPVHFREASERFIECHKENEGSSNPIIQNDRYIVYRERKFTFADDYMLSEDIYPKISVGSLIEQQWEKRSLIPTQFIFDEFKSVLVENQIFP